MQGSQLLIVSNRLPVIAAVADGHACLSDANGGSAAGLRPYHENSPNPTAREAVAATGAGTSRVRLVEIDDS